MPSVVRTLLRWGLRSYAFYLLLCLLVILPALNILTPRIADSALNRELRSELILFNPFSLTLEARGVTVTEKGGHVPLGFESLQINLSLESLWKPGVVLDAITVDQLDVHVLRDAAGQFHFADLVSEGEEPDPDTQAALPAVTIHDLLVQAHTLRFTDETRPGPYTTAQRDFRVRTKNLTTVPDRQSDGELIVTGDGGGVLRWSGELQVAAANSQGTITLQDIDLTPVWRYDAETLPFVVESAKFSAIVNYQVDWSGELDARVSDSEIRLHSAAITPSDPARLPNTAIKLSELALAGISLDLQTESVALEAVTVDGLAISGFDESGQPSVLDMFQPASDLDSPSGGNGGSGAAAQTNSGDRAEAPSNIENDTTDTESSWSVALDALSVQRSQLTWRTAYLSPDVLQVSPIDVSAKNIAWPAVADAPFQVALAINEQTTLDIAGAANATKGSGSAIITLKSWQLPWLNPLVNEQARAHIGRGELSLESTVGFEDFAASSVQAALEISDYSTVLDETQEEAFTLQALELAGVSVDVPKQSLTIQSLGLLAPVGSLHIREDGVINVNGIVRSGPDDQVSADTMGRDDMSDHRGNRRGNSSSNESREEAGDAGSDEEETSPWRVQLAKINIRKGRLDFADASLPLPFKTLIDEVEADIQDIDTASEKPLTVELKGNVDGYAPVLILASGKPFADQRDGELQFTFRGMDIATMSPYSGTYAGYSLDSGTLSLDLRYALDGQTLEGDNRIIISQMELGEPVESDLAIKAPLKLGIALLTDSKGVIDLSVPISGDVDSPGFSLGPIIGRAISNVIVKAVTAPFSLLAGLVGSDDDLENIAFKAGSSELDSSARRAVDALGSALLERPQISLRVAGGYDPENDAAVLKQDALRQELLAQGITAAMIDTGAPQFVDVLQTRYRALALAEIAAEQNTDEQDTVEVAAMWQALVDVTPLSSNALQDLATARAASAKRELVTVGGVDPARVAISFDAELASSSVQMVVES